MLSNGRLLNFKRGRDSRFRNICEIGECHRSHRHHGAGRGGGLDSKGVTNNSPDKKHELDQSELPADPVTCPRRGGWLSLFFFRLKQPRAPFSRPSEFWIENRPFDGSAGQKVADMGSCHLAPAF
jgi:hypothetical protein